MASIDANDDTKTRWIVYHYRYDPERREWNRFIGEAGRQLQEAKEAGIAEAKEHISGRPRPAGYDRDWKQVRDFR